MRRATVEDAEVLARVHIASWQGAYRGLVPDAMLDGLDVQAWTRMKARHLEQGAVMWLVDEGLGFAHAGPARGAAGGELYAIYLHPDHFGRGLGRALLAEVEAWLDEHFSEAELWVLEGNARARRFYGLAGWRLVDVAAKTELLGVELDVVRYVRP